MSARRWKVTKKEEILHVLKAGNVTKKGEIFQKKRKCQQKGVRLLMGNVSKKGKIVEKGENVSKNRNDY